MKKNMVITIGRQFGSGGHEIGAKLAEKLGLAFYDEEIITEAAKSANVPEDKIKAFDENRGKPLFKPSSEGDYMILKKAPLYQYTQSDKVFELEASVIRAAAKAGNCVIVGHCGNYILKDTPTTLSAYIYAPDDFRADRVMNYYGAENRDDALKKIHDMDAQRRNYYQYYAGYEWGGREGRDLLINSASLGIDATVDLLAEVAEKKASMNAAADAIMAG